MLNKKEVDMSILISGEKTHAKTWMYVKCYEVNYNYKPYVSYICSRKNIYTGEELPFFRAKILELFHDLNFEQEFGNRWGQLSGSEDTHLWGCSPLSQPSNVEGPEREGPCLS